MSCHAVRLTVGLALALVAACAESPGRVSVEFSWGPEGRPRQPGATLFVRVGELSSAGADIASARTLATAAPVGVSAATAVELGGVPNGERRVVIVEVRETDALESELLRYGVSPAFAVSAGQTATVQVEASLRRPVVARGAVRVAGSSTTALVARGVVEVWLEAPGAVRAELSGFETFPSASTGCFGLARAREGCATLSPSCEGTRCVFTTDWDVNTGLDDDCGLDPARGHTWQDRCARRVYARFFDDNGVASPPTSVDVVLDSRAPTVEAAELGYEPAPGGLLGRVEAAQVGAGVELSFVTSEPVARAPDRLRARAPSGATLELARLVSGPGTLTLRYAVTVPAGTTDGAYAVDPVPLSDLAGNTATVALAVAALQVRVSTPTLSLRQDLVSYLRAPAKSALAESRGAFSLPAGETYFALGPADALDGAASLPTEAFTLADGPVAALRVFADAARSSLLVPLIRPDADGRWSRDRLRLPNLDAPAVYVTALDAAGNESAPVLIESVWFLRSTAERDADLVRVGAVEDPRFPRSPAISLPGADRVRALDAVALTRGAAYRWHVFGAVVPPGFALGGAAFDRASGELVMRAAFDTAETWIWRDARFENATLRAGSITGSGGESLVYDSARARVVAIEESGTTHEWDGARWTRISTSRVPNAMGAWGVTYDAARRRVVLFGGAGGASGASNRTWTYDGVDWTDVTPATGPPARYLPVLGFDEGLGVVVLVGGSMGYDSATNRDMVTEDTWIWDGSTWTDVTNPARQPPGRSAGSLQYDEVRQRLVLHGGLSPDWLNGGSVRDLWEWDGAGWTERTGATLPPETGPSAYDTGRGQILSWGGTYAEVELGPLARMRAWDGSRWRVVSSTTTPPSPQSAAYDPVRDRVVLGSSAGTFEWDGESWVRTATFTPGGDQTTMVYDAARAQMTLLCLVGQRVDGVRIFRLETWAYRGSRWTRLADFPSPRPDFSLVYDEASAQVLLFGGRRSSGTGNLLFGDTWAFDGVAWRELASAAPRMNAAMAYDRGRGRVVRFGGFSRYVFIREFEFDTERQNDVWEWDGRAWIEVTPASGAGPISAAQDRLEYDARLERVVFARPGESAWAWDGARWQDVSPPTRGLPSVGGLPLAADARGIVAPWPGADELGHTFRMEAVTPTLIVDARAPRDVALDDIEALRVRVFCSATQPTAGAGARLAAWNGRRWERLASGPGALEHTVDRDAARFIAGGDGRSFLACSADADVPHLRSEVSLDYAEVWYRYRAPK